MTHRFHPAKALVLAPVLLLAIGFATPARAQGQKGMIGGGAGFAALKNPDLNHGRSAVVGGFIGYRFTDNFSIEGGFRFARSSRTFDESSEPVDQNQGIPAFRYDTNRYQLDGSLVYHIGRRQPFHPFILGGGGLVRRDEKQTDLMFTLNENGQVIETISDVSLDTTSYEPAAHVGAGFDIYFLYNLSARVEFRLNVPQTADKRTRMWIFSASYYF